MAKHDLTVDKSPIKLLFVNVDFFHHKKRVQISEQIDR